MALPKIVLVGRPNVGKSALFNQIVKKRIAIVDQAEGITRDRLYAQAELFGRPFELVDTGGIDPHSKAPFNEEIRQQALIAIEEGDGLILVVDGQVGPLELDREVARLLMRSGKPLVLAVNKIDAEMHEEKVVPFYGLGIGEVVGVSATQGRAIAELLEGALKGVPEGQKEENAPLKIAIIGRPNVGKSTLVNVLLDEERCIVSPIAGTTRDHIDTAFEYEGSAYTLIDTAGIRRKGSEHEVVEKFAAIRTKRAIERADICILVTDQLTTQDKRIATEIEEAGRGCLLLVNKWDLIKNTRMEHLLKEIRDEVPFLNHCPILFGSAKTGRNLPKLMEEVARIGKERVKKISTSALNKFVEATMQRVHPPMLRGKRLRIYYMTQVGNEPPRFLLFVNRPDLMAKSYERYLYNQFRETFGFIGNPITFHMKGKSIEMGRKTRARTP